MNIGSIKKLFPEGKSKVLTMSYDDSVVQDRKLVQIFNQHNIHGTFNLNSGSLGHEGYSMHDGRKVDRSHVAPEEVKELYANHEAAVHTLTHPWLNHLPKPAIIYQVMEDKKNIEELVGYPVRGMAYPFGTYNEEVLETLKELGIVFSRNTVSHHTFQLPKNPLEWGATCHHRDNKLMELAKDFVEAESNDDLKLFYVWGHSYEFDINQNWDVIENFCSYIANKPDVWYATNIQIIDYMEAANRLIFSATGAYVSNPSAIDVWISVNKQPFEVKSGCTVSLG